MTRAKILLGVFFKDIKLANRNLLIPIMILISVVFSILSAYILPEGIGKRSSIYCYVDGDENAKSFYSRQIENERSVVIVDSKKEVEDSVKKRPLSFGLIIKVNGDTTNVRAVLRGYESERMRRNIELLCSYITLDPPEIKGIEVFRIEENRILNQPFSKDIVPYMIFFQSCIITCLFSAMLFFVEKESGALLQTIISPASGLQIVISKVLLMTALGTLTGLLIAAWSVGVEIALFEVLLIVVSGSFVSACIGIIIGIAFENLYRASLSISLILTFLALPTISFLFDSKPGFFRLMPSSLILRSLQESVFMSNPNRIVFQSIGLSSILGLSLFVLGLVLFRRKVYGR